MEKGKVLALDYGSKRIGVATGDLEFKIAFPREIIENRSRDFVLARIKSLCEELSVQKIIVGWPLSMENDQEENKIMKQVRIFVETLKKAFDKQGIEVQLFDERLSSFEAVELLKEAGVLGNHVDAHAAQIILKRYFDNLSS